MNEAEKWARIIIFILVGGYAIVVLILTIRFVIRSCFLQRPQESSRWEQFLSENVARSQRGEAPPEFAEALSMKSPIAYIDVDEIQPPSYEEYVRRYSTDSIFQTNSLQLENYHNDRIPEECQLNITTPTKTNNDFHIDCDSLTGNLPYKN